VQLQSWDSWEQAVSDFSCASVSSHCDTNRCGPSSMLWRSSAPQSTVGHLWFAAGTPPGLALQAREEEPQRFLDGIVIASAAVVAALIPLAWLRLDLDLSTLFDARARRLASELVQDMFPPSFAGSLGRAAADSVAMASLAMALIAIPARRIGPGDLQPGGARTITSRGHREPPGCIGSGFDRDRGQLVQVAAYATLPATAGRFVTLGLYRC